MQRSYLDPSLLFRAILKVKLKVREKQNLKNRKRWYRMNGMFVKFSNEIKEPKVSDLITRLRYSYFHFNRPNTIVKTQNCG